MQNGNNDIRKYEHQHSSLFLPIKRDTYHEEMQLASQFCKYGFIVEKIAKVSHVLMGDTIQTRMFIFKWNLENQNQNFKYQYTNTEFNYINQIAEQKKKAA